LTRVKNMSADAASDGRSGSEAFEVFARIRPAATPDAVPLELKVQKRFGEQRTVRARNLEFLLDWVWDSECTQAEVYERGVGERVSWVLQGYNATVLAYGQTGSGKTHTMYGPDDVLTGFEGSMPEDHGIVPRVCAQLFASMEGADEVSTYIVHVSYIEVYNDRLRDLLGKKSALLLRESTAKGLMIEGLSHHLTSCPSEVIALVQRGNAQRTVAAMKMNERSSRGHAVLTLCVRELSARDGAERVSKFTFVDLAGMESSKKSYAVSGSSANPERREEVKHINTSLCALGTVIERLSALGPVPHNHQTRAWDPKPRGRTGQPKGHVPYRDSVLTRLLQDSLGGDCKCAIIATLRGEGDYYDESVNTLR
jgi:hypothetical protein